MTNTRFDLIPYEVNRDLLRAYEAAGHVVFIRKDRNGSTKVHLDGMRPMNVHDAMARVVRWSEQRQIAQYVAEGLGEMTDFCPSDNS